MKLHLSGFVWVAIYACASAQENGGERLVFAVASVKPSNDAAHPEIGNFNGRGHARNATLKMLIATAYQISPPQISGGPNWAGSDQFDVEAKAADPKTGYVQLRLMMRSLLEDRFQLKVHRETKISRVYSLVVAKGGAKLELSPDQVSSDAIGPPASPSDGPPRGSIMIGPGMLVANAITMPLLAKTLTRELERPVIDNTNLKDRFDIRLEWMPGAQPGEDTTAAGVTSNDRDLPSIFIALREQLGLEVKSARGPVEFLMIDSAEKPSPN